MRAQPTRLLIDRGRLPNCSRRHAIWLDGRERPSGRTAHRGITPSTIMSPTFGSRTEIRPGARAHPHDSDHSRRGERAPPRSHSALPPATPPTTGAHRNQTP